MTGAPYLTGAASLTAFVASPIRVLTDPAVEMRRQERLGLVSNRGPGPTTPGRGKSRPLLAAGSNAL
jgi:hypothetical protein